MAIASSSIYGSDAEERIVIRAEHDAAANTTLVVLDRPLASTHLGVVKTVAGDTRGHQLDMRAEVGRRLCRWPWPLLLSLLLHLLYLLCRWPCHCSLFHCSFHCCFISYCAGGRAHA